MAPKKTTQRLGAAHNALFLQIHEEMRRRIQNGDFKPGDRLVEDRLAEEFGVSRNPVREAIRLLSSDGLVEVNARRGVYVSVPEVEKARELVEIRAVLEGHNARLAARRGNPKLLAEAGKILEKGQAALAGKRTSALAQLNDDFHRALSRASENETLAEMLATLRLRSSLVFAMADPEVQGQSWQEHADILRAILDADEDKAAALSTDHVLRAGERARARRERLASDGELTQ
ncbi:GntR family transcriptional regulator [Pseudodonghicola xiamenensis]|uniref:GntR family transcriptional regulator n=1 Tax=Pseudodonghicola xiamenensis TaxID=337702 RepID=A0A8J3HBC9_9RHOB|nr:GntR family transcriptional regulator [Pseudodonghicola xiamenensis]GHH03923.1 GntR family transcriptional regulator [Pseudodonghicola xiamenensis]